MNYAEAAKIRKTGLGELITNRIIEGKNASITRAISDKFAARSVGFKETFGLMNLAKVLTGGSNIAAAFMGRMTGAKPEDIRHVTGRKQITKSYMDSYGMNRGSSTMSNEVLEKMLNFMQQTQVKEEERLETLMTYEEFQSKLREDHHREVMEILLKATLNKRRAEKQMKAETKKREQLERDKKSLETKKAEVPVVTAPKAPAPKPAPKVEPPVAKPTPKVQPPAVKPAPKVEPPVTRPAPKAEPVSKAPSKIPSATKIGKGMIVAQAVLLPALASAGITNVYAQRALLANVEKETGGTKMEENLTAYKGTSNKRIREIFKSRAVGYSDQQLNDIKKDPYKFGEFVYGKNTKIGQGMGNTESGDGYKYRGRGFIQLTGKNNYRAYSDVAGVDLVKNPDAMLDPVISAKVSVEFIKRGGKNLEFKNQQDADRAITQVIGGLGLNLNKGYGKELLAKVQKYSEKYSDVGSQIDDYSKNNADMKKEMGNSGSPVVIIENTNNTSQKTVNNTSVPHNNVNPRLRR